PGSSPKIPRNSPADRTTSMGGTLRLSPYKCRSRAYLTSRLPSGGSRRRADSAGISAFFCSITSFAGSTSRDSLVGLASSPGRADDKAQKPRPRQQAGQHIRADRHADSDDQHDHHHEAHQLLAHGVALRDAEDLSESELHGREDAAARPDQAADGDDTQQSGR